MISVGKIVGFHGVKGEVKVFPLTDDPGRFEKLERVFLTNKDNADDYTNVAHIEKTFWHKGNVVIKFKEFQNKNEVEFLKNYFIKILKEERPELDEGEYYYDEIIGLKVFDNIEGDYLGEIIEIKETGSNDVYVVRDMEKEILLPALEQVIKKIDLNSGIMKVELMEGLMD